MKLFNKVSILFASLALVMGAGLVGSNDAKEVKAADTVWTKVKDAATLIDGDKILIVNETKGVVNAAMNAKTGSYLKSVSSATFADDTIKNLPTGYEVLSLEGDSSGWYIKESRGYVFATKASKMSYNSSKPDLKWTISIDKDDNAIITAGSYGKILYNVNAPRFLNYTSATNVSMLLPQLYKLNVVEENKTLTSLIQTNTPEKLSYYAGEKFNPKGLTITAIYDDGSKKDVTSSCEWSIIDADEAGNGYTNGKYTENGITKEIKVYVSLIEYILKITDAPNIILPKQNGTLSYTLRHFKTEEDNSEEQAASWKSSSPDIIEIDEKTGKWTAKSAGTSTISLLLYVGDELVEYNASIEMTVCDTIENIVENYNTSDTYNFTGVITNIQGNSFYMQDGEYAVYVYNNNEELSNSLKVGDKVLVASKMTVYKGLLEAIPTSIETISENNVISPKLISTDEEFNNLCLSSLFSINSVTIANVTKDSKTNRISGTTTIGSSTFTLNVDKSVYSDELLHLLNSIGNKTFNIVGANVGMYDSRQIAITSASQIVIGADEFINEWAALRAAAGNEGICHYLSSANRAELDLLLKKYDTLCKNSANKTYIDAAKDGDTTIGNTITYVKNVIEGTQPTDKDYTNSGVIITSNYSIDSTSLIALFALLGIGALSAYYFIEKKKLSK